MRKLLPLCLALVSCNDGSPNLTRVGASGFFNPPEIRFGVRTIGVGHVLTTELTNTAPEDKRVIDVRTEPDEDVFQATLPDDTLRGSLLLANSRHMVSILYNPQEERTYDTNMLIVFSDFEIELPIIASAEIIPPAAPSLSPSRVIFPPTEVGRDVMQRVTMTNIGESDGALTQIKGVSSPFAVTAVGGGPLVVPTGAIRPNNSLEFEVHYRPTVETHNENGIEFSFDSGQSALLEVQGDSVAAGVLNCLGPIDFGDVPRGVRETRTVQCMATGGPYELASVQILDGGSQLYSIPNVPTELNSDDTLSFDVQFDASGLVERHNATIELVAEHGVITRVNLVAMVAPPLPGSTDIRLLLDWNTPWTDFDIHMVRAGGEPFADVDDCHFANKDPDWGVVGYPGDDPFLDGDDIDGFGPEELTLTFVGDQTPIYDVYVQYHSFTMDFGPATAVSVTYQLRDQAAVTIARDIFSCGNLWHVGRFRYDLAIPVFETVDTVSNAYQHKAGERCR